MSLTLGRFVEFPRAAPSGISQTSLGFRGLLITNFPHIMVLLIINWFLMALREQREYPQA